MGEYYGGLLGRGNYERFLRPFLAAVPSQDADGFPAAGPGSLFKKRPRRKEFPRSYGFDGGLQTVCEAALRTPGLRVDDRGGGHPHRPGGRGIRRHDRGRADLRGAARRGCDCRSMRRRPCSAGISPSWGRPWLR